MYQDAHNTIMELLKNPLITKVSFLKSGGIKVKFTFAQNKVLYDSMQDLLDSIEILDNL